MRISDWSSDVCSSDLVTFLELIELVTVVIVVHRGDGPPIFVDVETTGLERVAGTRTQIRLDDPDTMQFITRQILIQMARTDRKSTRLNSSHYCASRMPSAA